MNVGDGSDPDDGAGNGADVTIGPDPDWGSDPDVTGGCVAVQGAATSGPGCDIGPAGGGGKDIKVGCGSQDSDGATVPPPGDEIGPDGGGGKGAEVSREGGGGASGDRLPVSRPRTSLVRSLAAALVPIVVLKGSNWTVSSETSSLEMTLVGALAASNSFASVGVISTGTSIPPSWVQNLCVSVG